LQGVLNLGVNAIVNVYSSLSLFLFLIKLTISDSWFNSYFVRLLNCNFSGLVLSEKKTIAKGHQLYVTHLLRYVNFIEELDKTDWAKRFKQLSKQALMLKMSLSEYSRYDPKVMELENDLEEFLLEDIHTTKYKNTRTLQKTKTDY
jgi:hypothetical protein